MTGRSEIFIDHYVATGKVGKSAEAAGYAVPGVAGSKVLARPDVRAEIARRRAELADRLDAVTDSAIEAMGDDAKFKKAGLDELSRVTARNIQAAALLRGDPTAITASATGVIIELGDTARSALQLLAASIGVIPSALAAELGLPGEIGEVSEVKNITSDETSQSVEVIKATNRAIKATNRRAAIKARNITGANHTPPLTPRCKAKRSARSKAK